MQVEVNESILCHRPLIVTVLDEVANKLKSNQQFKVVNLSEIRLLVSLDENRNKPCCKPHSTDKRLFKILLSKNSMPHLKEILAHELCHVFQMVSGSLVIDGENIIWKGSLYRPAEIKHNKRPWEQEAMLLSYNCLVNT
ncbi:hypothetical protein ACXHQK_22520 [Vibrio chemaguriensis]